MKKLYTVIFFITTFFAGYTQNYLSEVKTYKEYKSFTGKPLSNKFSNIESVKIVYDLENKKIYYFNSSIIRLHYDFVVNHLGYNKELEVFNGTNYSEKESDRSFLLGNLNHIKGTDKWIFELSSLDKMPVTLIEKFYKLVTNSFYVGNRIQFYLNTRDKIEWFAQNKFKIPCVKSDYIFAELQYQEVVSGKTIGVLKSYSVSDLEIVKPKYNEIILIDGTPNTLPNVKGIIVNELQTPLSHLVILGKNRKIPIMAYRSVFQDKKIKSLIGKTVELKIDIDTFYIHETTKKIKENKLLKKRKLTIDTLVKTIVDLSSIHKNGINYIGAKAHNLSYLIAIAKENDFKVPENAHAIPFYFYKKHMAKKEIAILIDELLQYPYQDSTKWINNQLQKIRNEIKKTPIDGNLISMIHQKLKASNFKKFRFRSSTNAEDIEGFNGAGLYESKTGIMGDSIKTFEKAIKQVWASVWNESSYWEREIFGIDQQNIAMGVLIHRSFPDELANGVVITKNIFRETLEGVTVNIQKGENSVVKPAKGEICEQFTIYNFNLSNIYEKNTKTDVDYVSHSNLNDNKPLLTSVEINKLYFICKKIETKMNKFWRNNLPKPIDIEFKIVGDERELYIKQVRIFND